jgi:hypothetical protein
MKIRAAHDGRKLKDVAAELLKRGLNSEATSRTVPTATKGTIKLPLFPSPNLNTPTSSAFSTAARMRGPSSSGQVRQTRLRRLELRRLPLPTPHRKIPLPLRPQARPHRHHPQRSPSPHPRQHAWADKRHRRRHRPCAGQKSQRPLPRRRKTASITPKTKAMNHNPLVTEILRIRAEIP